jgi:hypothetical protein
VGPINQGGRRLGEIGVKPGSPTCQPISTVEHRSPRTRPVSFRPISKLPTVATLPTVAPSPRRTERVMASRDAAESPRFASHRHGPTAAVLKDGGAGVVLSPRFRSAAELTGWDEESILLAALVVEDTPVRESRRKRRSSTSAGGGGSTGSNTRCSVPFDLAGLISASPVFLVGFLIPVPMPRSCRSRRQTSAVMLPVVLA